MRLPALRLPVTFFLVLLTGLALLPAHAAAAFAQQPDPDQLAQQGQLAMQTGHIEEAEAAFTQLAHLQPTVAEIHATLGVLYFQDGKLDLAIDSLRHALKLKPTLSKAGILLSICLSEVGKSSEAIPGLIKGFHSTADPEQRRMCGLELMRAYTAQHRDAEAVQTGLELEKAFPDDAEILYQAGRIYANFAYLSLQKLQDKAPNSVWAIQSAAEANETSKNYEAALQDYNHVLAIEPHRPGIHYRLGRVYLARYEDQRKTADQDAARREFEAELTVDPGNANAGYELANILVSLGSLDDATRLYEQITAHFPDFEEALVGLGGVYSDTGKPDKAVPVLEHAAALRPGDEVAWYRLARAQHAVGNSTGQAKALAEYKRIHTAVNAAATKSNPTESVTPQTVGTDANP